uniref:Uncharacterized protein n=1 Tax=viral metagenome TaxID=1070528 RepID=A0A6C0C5C5_9ZZZZ
METKYITLGIQLYGRQIDISYYGFVDSKKPHPFAVTDMMTIYPLGRKITYMIQDIEFAGFIDIPVLIYYSNNTIKITNEHKFNEMLEYLIGQFDKNNLTLYENVGVEIEYIDIRPLINPNNRITTLVNDQSPKQDRLRVLYDTIDQLVKPTSNVKIIYKCNDSSNNILICQIKTRMMYRYGEGYFLFYNDAVGTCKYDIYTGHMDMAWRDSVLHNIKSEYKKSYPNNFRYNVYDDVEEIESIQPTWRFNIDEYTTNLPNFDNRINVSLISMEIDVNFMLDMS